MIGPEFVPGVEVSHEAAGGEMQALAPIRNDVHVEPAEGLLAERSQRLLGGGFPRRAHDQDAHALVVGQGQGGEEVPSTVDRFARSASAQGAVVLGLGRVEVSGF